MTKPHKYFLLLLLGLLLAAGSLISCENELDPIDRDMGIYGIYGALDLDEEVNYIRVKDLNAEFTEAATNIIDATVTFENLETGAVQTLSSDIIKWEDIFLHNFIVNGPIEPDNLYQVKVQRSDGVSVSIDTKSPTMPVPVPKPINQDCYTPIILTFEPTNGGTIELRVNIYGSHWGVPQVLTANEDQPNKITYEFTPKSRLEFVPLVGPFLRCYDKRNNKVRIAYAHFGPGSYEKFYSEDFKILESTDRFGTLYQDTLTFPIDTSRVCPQDCQPDE